MPNTPQDNKVIISGDREFAAAFELGRTSNQAEAQVHNIGKGGPFLLIEQDKLTVHCVERFAEAPSRIRQEVNLSDAESFIRYVNDFKDSQSRIFALFGDQGGKFRAVLDYHESPLDPRWCTHIAVYTCPTTPEWDAWLMLNAKMLSQVDFSEFVEKQRLAFKTPDAATMLEIARTLEASQTGSFKSELNPTNGNRHLIYKDEVNASAGGSSKIAIPSSITVMLQPFRRGSLYQVEARLIYRIRDGKVTFQYELIRAHEIIEIALKEISTQIVDKVGITPYNGTL